MADMIMCRAIRRFTQTTMRGDEVDPFRGETVASACRDYASMVPRQTDDDDSLPGDWPVMRDRG